MVVLFFRVLCCVPASSVPQRPKRISLPRLTIESLKPPGLGLFPFQTIGFHKRLTRPIPALGAFRIRRQFLFPATLGHGKTPIALFWAILATECRLGARSGPRTGADAVAALG
jgi:hypothetical protein